jgi:hypothetical protein
MWHHYPVLLYLPPCVSYRLHACLLLLSLYVITCQHTQLSHPGIQLRCLSYLRWLVWCAQPGIIISVVSLSIALFRVFARDHPLAATIAPVANTTGT